MGKKIVMKARQNDEQHKIMCSSIRPRLKIHREYRIINYNVGNKWLIIGAILQYNKLVYYSIAS